MNQILWDLINIGEVASFIDDIIVGMEEEKHDKIVEEVIKILVENNLYVKLEKCKWKIKKIRFLGVVIGPDRIKMEEEKVREVLDWLTPQRVKNTQKFLGLANYYWQFINILHSQPEYYTTWLKMIRNGIGQKNKIKHVFKERFTKEPVLAVPDLDKKNKNRSQCIRLYNRRSFINRI